MSTSGYTGAPLAGRHIGFESAEQRDARLQSQLFGSASASHAKQRPEASEVWYARMPGESELRTVKIVETTGRTVSLYRVDVPLGSARTQRFEHSDVKFVEKAK